MDNEPQSPPEEAVEEVPLHGVLIVDDSVLMQRRLRELVEQQRYEVVGVAGSGEQALLMIPTLRPRVILLDHNLPQMSGLQFIKGLRASHPDIRVIVCSGSLTLQTGREFLAAGAKEMLAKPVQLDMFSKALKRCMTE